MGITELDAYSIMFSEKIYIFCKYKIFSIDLLTVIIDNPYKKELLQFKD